MRLLDTLEGGSRRENITTVELWNRTKNNVSFFSAKNYDACVLVQILWLKSWPVLQQHGSVWLIA